MSPPAHIFRLRRLDIGDRDWRELHAIDAEIAARTLVAQHESETVEFPVAAGHEIALVEVEGHGTFEVHGDPGPHYLTRRRSAGAPS